MHRIKAVLAAALFFLSGFGVCADNLTHPTINPPAETTAPTDPHPYFRFKGEVIDSTVKEAIDFIHDANKNKAQVVIFEFDTPGGGVDAGLDLAMEIERSTVPVYCIVDNDAFSMGFVLFESCNLRILTKRAELMAHEVSGAGVVSGKKYKFQDIARDLDRTDKQIAERVAPRLRMTVHVFQERIRNQEWWMDWQEALHAHAVDYVVDTFADARALAVNLSGP